MCFSSKTETSSTQTSTSTPEEKAMMAAQLKQFHEIEPQQTEYYKSSYDLATELMEGGELPGIFKTLAGGIDQDVIAEQATNYVADAMPQAQSMGITDSGVIAKAMAKGVASDVLLPTAEYNSNLLLNLMNLATGQSAQGTNQFSSGTSTLANQLAGLRSTTTSGTSTYTPSGFSSITSGIGTLASGIGGLGTGLGWGKSSQRYKTNIKLWE